MEAAELPPGVTLREAGAADAPAVADLYGWWVLHGTGTFEEVPPTRADMAARMAAVTDVGLPWLLAEADGRLLGYGYAGPYRPRIGYRFTVEDTVYVAPDAAGRGVGKALLNALIDRCTRLGRKRMIAAIGDSDNAASIALHRACGFEPCGRLTAVGFKFGRWLDVVWMQRSLGNDEDGTS